MLRDEWDTFWHFLVVVSMWSKLFHQCHPMWFRLLFFNNGRIFTYLSHPHVFIGSFHTFNSRICDNCKCLDFSATHQMCETQRCCAGIRCAFTKSIRWYKLTHYRSDRYWVGSAFIFICMHVAYKYEQLMLKMKPIQKLESVSYWPAYTVNKVHFLHLYTIYIHISSTMHLFLIHAWTTINN